MTWDRIERLVGTENLERLHQKRVGVVGLGSGGGFVAQSLAMSGVGHFVLVDDDVLEAENVVRHVADKRGIGRPKADIMAELITLRNADAEVEVVVGRVEDHPDMLDGLDLLIVGVDGEGSKYKLNELALEKQLTAVYAGVYERGEGGDVVVIRPYDGPCYSCWSSELREGLTVSKNDAGELDYGMIGPEGTLEAEPGLWVHVVRVASVQSDFVLRELLKESDLYEPLPGNTVILANKALEIIEGEVTPPYSAVWVNVQRDPECLVCGDAVQAARLRDKDEVVSLDQLPIDVEIEFDEDEAQQGVSDK